MTIVKSEFTKQYKRKIFHNYYINLFNILLLMDLDNNNNRKYYIIYDNNTIRLIKDNEFEYNDYYIKSIFFNKNDFIKYNNVYYNALYQVLSISTTTYRILMDSKILEYNFEKDYDKIAEKLTELSLLAQENLVRYIRKFINSKHSIVDLLNDMVLSYNNGFESDNFFYHSCNHINNKKEDYYINNYNKIYEYFYINNLLLTTLYIKYITIWQVKGSNVFNDINDKKLISNVLCCIGASYENFMEYLDHIFQTNNDSNALLNINKATQIFNYNKSNQSRMEFNNSIINSDNILQSANTILNIYNMTPHLNVRLAHKIDLIAPLFETISNKSFMHPLSKILKNASILEYLTQNTIEKYNAYISKPKVDSYGEVMLLSDVNPMSPIQHIYRNDITDAISNQIDKLSYTPYYGYMQNNNTNICSNDKYQYLSCIWLRPFFVNELCTNIPTQLLLAPSSTRYDPMTNRNILYGNLRVTNNTRYSIYNTIITIMPQYHLIKTLSSSKSSSHSSFNEVHPVYKTSLSSMILMRMYMIAILEYIAKTLKPDNLTAPISIDDYNLIEQYFTFNINTNTITNNFKKLINIKIYHENGDVDINKMHYMFTITATNKANLIYKFGFKSNAFMNTFATYMVESLKLTQPLLTRLSDLAKEDIISCPMY